jgi:segregation and condensation protein B
MVNPDLLKRVIEAALLASTQPLGVEQLQELFDDHERPTVTDVSMALAALRTDYETRGVQLQEVASGFRFQVQLDVFPYISKMWTERQVRYTRATLETLALVAYRQPITRAEIEAIRGVSVSSQIIKSLEEREWIRVVGHRDLPGKPALFGTTKQFLDYFNLRSLDELPTLAQIRDLTQLEPELQFPTLDSLIPATAEMSAALPSTELIAPTSETLQ